jgi:hypothetical protein
MEEMKNLRPNPGASEKKKVDAQLEDVTLSSTATSVKLPGLPELAAEGAEFMAEEEARTGSEVSDTSWDMLEDFGQNSSFLLILNGSPVGTPTPQYSILDTENDTAGAHKQFAQHSTKTDSQHPSRSYLSSRSKRLPNSPKESLKSLGPIEKPGVLQNIHDLSTQSTNTSSHPKILTGQNYLGNSSTPDISHKDSAIAKGDSSEPRHDPNDAALERENFVGEAQDEMEHIIQKALSQECPSIGSEGSVENAPIHAYEKPIPHENLERAEFMDHEPRVPQNNENATKCHGHQTPNSTSVKRSELNIKMGSIAESSSENIALPASSDEENFSAEFSNGKAAVFVIEIGSKSVTGSNNEDSSTACRLKLLSDQFIPTVTELESSLHLPAVISIKNGMEYRRDDHPETETTKVSKAESEASWEGCGTQSPWAVDGLGVLPPGIAFKSNKDKSFISVHSRREESGRLKSLSAGNLVGDSDWEDVERPQTPEDGGIKPFKDIMAPTPSSEPEQEHEEANGLSSTQLLVEATTKNPWTSNFRKPSLEKSKKRVSFGVLSEEEGSHHPENTRILIKQALRSPPPPDPSEPVNEDIFKHGATVVNRRSKHFPPATYQKIFERILPGDAASPSSPALSAQAEAFMQADRETLREQDRFATLGEAWSRHLQPRSIANDNVLWKGGAEKDLSLMDATPPSTVRKDVSALNDFAMDEVLSEVGNFLEDWSVDTELKKAKESDNSKQSQNTGYRRRRLFGIL